MWLSGDHINNVAMVAASIFMIGSTCELIYKTFGLGVTNTREYLIVARKVNGATDLSSGDVHFQFCVI